MTLIKCEDKWNEVYGLNKDPIREYLIYPLLMKISGPIKNKIILDVGCGNGSLIFKLLDKKFKKIYGIDLSDKFISFAKKHIKDKRVVFKKRDIKKEFSFRKNYFDLIYCIFVFNEIDEIKNTLNEISRVLKKRSKFFLVTIHPYFPMTYYLYEKFTGKKNDKIKNVKGYFDKFRGKYVLTIAKETTPFCHHRFEEIVNGLIKSNLKIKQIKEMSVNKKILSKYPRYAEYKNMPRFLLIETQKE